MADAVVRADVLQAGLIDRADAADYPGELLFGEEEGGILIPSLRTK